jgi:hypothetical protein
MAARAYFAELLVLVAHNLDVLPCHDFDEMDNCGTQVMLTLSRFSRATTASFEVQCARKNLGL